MKTKQTLNMMSHTDTFRTGSVITFFPKHFLSHIHTHTLPYSLQGFKKFSLSLSVTISDTRVRALLRRSWKSCIKRFGEDKFCCWMSDVWNTGFRVTKTLRASLKAVLSSASQPQEALTSPWVRPLELPAPGHGTSFLGREEANRVSNMPITSSRSCW